MYLNDAREVVQVRKEQEPVKADPRFVAFGSEVQRAGRGHSVGRPERAHMPDMICRNVNGRHACYDYGDYCPAVEPRVYEHQQERPIVFRPTRPAR